ncbi:MAG: 2-amino-4-hydroxy-6-hydroxymethyldihydropteridine diphosphokinase [Sphingobacteriales bacterium]|nr:2-amino-4-hydroxy-6-hydroxymethyldihydropteridine diphosphokinase [Sphingobacteriales bacterium]
MAKLILLIGGNMGDRVKHLVVAKKHINKYIGKIIRCSAYYETAAWGNTEQPDFLNQVLVVETKKMAAEVMQQILSIEKELGRVRTIKNAPRVIDIDILFYGKEIYTSETLTVPHPQIPNRRFVLVPLNELIPQFQHPVLKKSIHWLLLKCKDPLEVKKLVW